MTTHISPQRVTNVTPQGKRFRIIGGDLYLSMRAYCPAPDDEGEHQASTTTYALQLTTDWRAERASAPSVANLQQRYSGEKRPW